MGTLQPWKSTFTSIRILSVLLLFTFTDSQNLTRLSITEGGSEDVSQSQGVHLFQQGQQVVLDNGIVNVAFSMVGHVTSITYKGSDNLLEAQNAEDDRGYWSVVWNKPGEKTSMERLQGNYRVIVQNPEKTEISFATTWTAGSASVPLNVDKRFVMLRGAPGLYTYTVLEKHKGWPALDIQIARVVFKPQENMFHYMSMSDERQRFMPMPIDRRNGQVLGYKEAVLLTNPTNPEFKGEVDDKYLYSCDNKDNKVHGWVRDDLGVGIWMITPSIEFKTGGPLKQDLTSHVGPTMLSVFISPHYAGEDLAPKFEAQNYWKKVLGPVFVYLNSDVSAKTNPSVLWDDAKQRMSKEVASWPYDFPVSNDFLKSKQRGSVSGKLLVHDSAIRGTNYANFGYLTSYKNINPDYCKMNYRVSLCYIGSVSLPIPIPLDHGKHLITSQGNKYLRYINKEPVPAASAYVGLAAVGGPGSWQTESKGYQFWTQTDGNGNFLIKNVIPGAYSLFAWVTGTVGDYKHPSDIIVQPGSNIKLNNAIFEAPRIGPTLWEIGVPDRTAAEFFIPDPIYKMHPYKIYTERFRQYGLWARYADLYPTSDLVYTIGKSNYRKDWFFSQVTRKIGDKQYETTTWRILFDLQNVSKGANYTLQLALASANGAELQVRINDKNSHPLFTTTLIGKDNALARHGIHGLYHFYSISIAGSRLVDDMNTIFLTQAVNLGPFREVMYDYIRLEGPAV